MTLDEAIKHADEKAAELIKQAEQLRDIGERISNPKQPYNEPVKACRDCAEEHRQLAEWLKELKQLRNQTSWIPVSEKLPDLYAVVLVTDECGIVFEYERRQLDDDGNVCKEWSFLNRNIIAWMPLPEPYKAESEE